MIDVELQMTDATSVTVSLVSMPWANPTIAPIQIAALKSHLDSVFGADVTVTNHSAFVDVMFDVAGPHLQTFCRYYPEDLAEHVSMLVYGRHFGLIQSTEDFEGFLRTINAVAKERAASYQDGVDFVMTPRLLDDLARSVVAFTERRIVPTLKSDSVNIIGFTMTYNQVYLSVFVARYLRDHYMDVFDMRFVFGGSSAALPNVAELIHRLGIDGHLVIGEGEAKLEAIVRTCRSADAAFSPGLAAAIASSEVGVIGIGSDVDLVEESPEFFGQQIELEDLAEPDYDEYFATLRSLCDREETYAGLRRHIRLAVEGTRGCFARCDFCGLNRNWSGFRKRSSERVVDAALRLRTRHRVNFVNYVDNVCDTWAEQYAEDLIARRVRIPAWMELRVHHPEQFWTKLSLAGVSRIQVGLEALSPPLLKAMRKGTRVIANLRVQKYLAELGIQSLGMLITHHPRSTFEDVVETTRVLRATVHFQQPELSRFRLAAGSPLYRELTPEQRRELKPLRGIDTPASLRPWAVEADFCMPAVWERPEVDDAWDELARWWDRFRVVETAARSELVVTECSDDGLWLQGRRGASHFEHIYDGRYAKIYLTCHHGASLEKLSSAVDLPEAFIEPAVRQLVDDGVLLAVDGQFLSLACRPRDELVRSVHSGASVDTPVQSGRDVPSVDPGLGSCGGVRIAVTQR